MVNLSLTQHSKICRIYDENKLAIAKKKVTRINSYHISLLPQIKFDIGNRPRSLVNEWLAQN